MLPNNVHIHKELKLVYIRHISCNNVEDVESLGFAETNHIEYNIYNYLFEQQILRDFF
jgi:hypothetical protein